MMIVSRAGSSVSATSWNPFWGRIGTSGRELVQEFAIKLEASQALAQAKRRRGDRDL